MKEKALTILIDMVLQSIPALQVIIFLKNYFRNYCFNSLIGQQYDRGHAQWPERRGNARRGFSDFDDDEMDEPEYSRPISM